MGFDNECILNIQSLAGEYFCPVCRTLVYPHEALQTQCTHLYCKPCLTYVAGSTQACPYDGYLVTEAGSKPLMETNKALAETIGKTSVHCLYHRSGCVWQGPLSECTGHCSGCAFGNSPVVCNRCGIQIVHRQVQEHAQTCNGANANSQLQGSERAQDAGVSVDQSKIINQATPAVSQAQTMTASHVVQNVNQTPPTNPVPQVAATTGAPAPEQWYQQYQQYYQQYPGYDPYQQQQQQQYYPQPPTQQQSQPQIQTPVQAQPQQFQMQAQVPASVPQNQGQVNAQPQQQVYQPPQSYPQAPVQPQMQYQQQPQPHFQPLPQHPPVAGYPSQPHQPPMQHAQYPQPPPSHMRPPHMLPSQQHVHPSLPAHTRPIVHQVQQPPPQAYPGQPFAQVRPPTGFVQPQPPPQGYMGRPPLGGQFPQPQPSGITPPPHSSQPQINVNQYTPPPPLGAALVEQQQQDNKPESLGNDFNQVKPEAGNGGEDGKEGGTSMQRVKEDEIKQGEPQSELNNGISSQSQTPPLTEQQRPLRPPGPFHPDNNNRYARMSQGDPFPSHFDNRRPDPHLPGNVDRGGPYGNRPPPFGLEPNSMRMNGDDKFNTRGSPKYASHSHSSRPFSGYGMDGRFLDKDPHGYYGGGRPPFDDNRPRLFEEGFGGHHGPRSFGGGPHNFDSFGDRFGPPHMHRGGEFDGPGKPPFGLRNRPHPHVGFQDYNHKPPFGEPFKSDRPHIGQPGFRSKGFPGDAGFFPGGPDSFDGLRKRKTNNSMGWCRICKIDCETVEGLDMHGQTREHQRMAMDMVITIKQNNSKKHKASNEHSAREEPSKLRNTERVNAS